MKRLVLSTTLGIIAINPLLASNNNLDFPVKINHINAAVLANALAGLDLNDGDKTNSTQTMGEYVTGVQKEYALSLKAYMDLANANQDRVVTEILRPRTEIYQPCKDGMFVYKLPSTTSVMNNYLHRASVNCFMEIKKMSLTNFDRDFARKAIFAIFIKNHLPALEQTYKEIMVCQQALNAPGINFISSSLVAFTDEATEEAQKLATAAVQYLSNKLDLKGDQTSIVKAFMEALQNPVFVEVSEANELMISNVRGVTRD